MVGIVAGRVLKILVVAFGGRGDIHPTLAVVQALRGRGHKVLFAFNPYFEPLARNLGLGFVGHGSAEALDSHMRSAGFESRVKRLARALTPRRDRGCSAQ